MGPESPRITELRRRVESDPSSIAFAQLAEEYRRAGDYEAAERYCRTGLARHPAYLSARVTLGRTLIELNKLEEAEHELQHVLTAAPDNLAALRGAAEIHQRLHNHEAALEYYRRALALSRHDPELEEMVDRLQREITPLPPPPAPDALMDFDALLDSLGVKDRAAPHGLEARLDQSSVAGHQSSAGSPQVPTADPPSTRVGTLDSALQQFPADDRPPRSQGSGPEPDWMSGPLPEIGPSAAEEAFEPVESVAREEPVAFDAPVLPDGAGAPPGPGATDARVARDARGEGMILDELEAWLKAIKR